MSIFSKLRRAKQAANSQKDKKSAESDSASKPVPYKHVPTHAATDALLGAPATWREEDKKAIQVQRQKRNQHQLSRNPSSLSNVTTLNRDQSFTWTDKSNSVMDQRKGYPVEWAPMANAPRKGHVTPTGWSSTTNFSRRSQLPPQERAPSHTDVRRSRFDTTESMPSASSATEGRDESRYKSSIAPSKDVKFYLPSHEAETSPSYSEDNSNSSSRDSSLYEPFVPARHPRRPKTLQSPDRRSDDQYSFQQAPKHQNRRVGEGPRLSAFPAAPDHFPAPGPTAPTENDLSFIDFEGSSSRHSQYPVTAF